MRSAPASLLLVLSLLAGRVQVQAQAPARSGPGRAQAIAIAQHALISLPPPPAWDQSTPAKIWSIDDIRAEFAKITTTPPQVNFTRTQFLQPDHGWMMQFKTWFLRLEKPLKMRFENQLWDCDNYSNCFVAFADLLALRAGETRAAFCVGWASVYYQRPFGGIRRGPHAVVIVGTDRGLFIIEPQTGDSVALRDFPNRDTIEAVHF